MIFFFSCVHFNHRPRIILSLKNITVNGCSAFRLYDRKLTLTACGLSRIMVLLRVQISEWSRCSLSEKFTNGNENKTVDDYEKLVAELMSIRARGETPLAYIRTYGCQQNVSDSEKIKGMLSAMGYGFTDNVQDADFILFNTCAVREHAEDRVFGNVGALKTLKRKHASVLIALCGCMMEQEHIAKRIYESLPFVGLVFGTNYLHQFPQLLYSNLLTGKRVFRRGHDDKKIYEDI